MSSHHLQVVARRCFAGGNRTELQLHTRKRKYTLNRSQFWGLTLREKVYIMQHVNLFLDGVVHGGESGVTSPLLARNPDV
jgi:hypothetical protein